MDRELTPLLARFFTDLKHVLTPSTLTRVVRQLLANDAMALGGQLAYFFLLFLFPFLGFLVSLGGLVVADPEAILKTLVVSTQGFLPQAAIEILSNQLDRTLRSPSSLAFLISGLLTFAMGSVCASQIISAANRAYGVTETRPFWKRWLIALLLILGFTLLIATMAFMVLSPHSGAYLQRTIGVPGVLVDLWGGLSWVIAFLNLTLAFAILYYMAPNTELSFRWVTPGGLMTTVLLLVSSQIFILWANNIFRSNQLFGQLGAGIVLLLWLFIIGLVVLFGIEIDAELARTAREYENAEHIELPKEHRRQQTGMPHTSWAQFFNDLKDLLGPTAPRRLVHQLLENGVLPLAGRLAYFFILFLFPFLVLMVSLVSIVISDPEPVLIGLAGRMEDFLPREMIEPVKSHLARTLEGVSSPTFVGSILFTLGVGSAAAETISNAANRSYGVRETRPFWKVRGVAILLIFAFMLLIVFLAFTLLRPHAGVYLQRALSLPEVFLGLWPLVSWAITFLTITIALGVLYYFAPNVDIPFRWITPGGFVATILLLVSNQILTLLVANFRYDLFYGQLGAGIVFLVWLYVAGLVVLIGLEINAMLAHMAEEHSLPTSSNLQKPLERDHD
jgi:membrane protein